MPIAGVVANRVTPSSGRATGRCPRPATLSARSAGAPATGSRAARCATLAEHQALAAAERRALERLFAEIDAPHAVVPRLESDVHDLQGLAMLAERL